MIAARLNLIVFLAVAHHLLVEFARLLEGLRYIDGRVEQFSFL